MRKFFYYSAALVLFLSTYPAAAQITVPAATELGSLDKLRGQHPRIFIDEAECKRIRSEITGSLAPEWDAVRKEVDTIIALGRPRYDEQSQAWGREDGNRLATLAFAWIVSGNQTYLDAATVWARAISSRPTWGRNQASGQALEYGLPFGHLLVGLAMFYDYARDEMDTETRDMVRRALRDHGATAAARLKAGTWDTAGHALQSNHTWVYATGVMASGLALLDEEPAAAEWIGLPLAILRASDDMLSPDGASQEGFGYHQYGVEYLLKLITLSEPLGFTEGKSPWWTHTGDYALAMLTPRKAWTKAASQVDFSDADRAPWYGPDHLLRWLARRNKDGVSQWLADSLIRADVGAPVSPWLALLWKDPAVKPVSPEGTPTLRYFDNMGIVSARSDWSGDEAMVVFKSGNPIGDQAARLHRERVHHGEYYHIHRDSNHFCLFGGGQWLIRNPGYGRWDTRFHNTLLVDGRGQKGDRDPAVPDEWPLTEASRFPRMVSVSSTPEVDRMVGDATAAYADDSGLNAYQRELIFIKPDVLVVVDRVTADRPRDLSILFLPETNPAQQPDGSYLAKIANTRLRLDPLSIEGATVTVGVLPLKARNARSPSELATWTLAKKAAQWTSVTALSWSATGTDPRQVKLEGTGENAVLRVGKQAVKINLSPLSPAKDKNSL